MFVFSLLAMTSSGGRERGTRARTVCPGKTFTIGQALKKFICTCPSFQTVWFKNHLCLPYFLDVQTFWSARKTAGQDDLAYFISIVYCRM